MKKQLYLSLMLFACMPHIIITMDEATKLANETYRLRRTHAQESRNQDETIQFKNEICALRCKQAQERRIQQEKFDLEIAQKEATIAQLKKNFDNEHEGYREQSQHLQYKNGDYANLHAKYTTLKKENAELVKTINAYERSALLCCFGTISTGIFWYINQTPDKSL